MQPADPTCDEESALPAKLDVSAFSAILNTEIKPHPRFERPLESNARPISLLNSPPWIRPLGKLGMDLSTQSWRFPLPPDQPLQQPPRPTPVAAPPEQPA